MFSEHEWLFFPGTLFQISHKIWQSLNSWVSDDTLFWVAKGNFSKISALLTHTILLFPSSSFSSSSSSPSSEHYACSICGYVSVRCANVCVSGRWYTICPAHRKVYEQLSSIATTPEILTTVFHLFTRKLARYQNYLNIKNGNNSWSKKLPSIFCHISSNHGAPSPGLSHGDIGGKISTEAIFEAKIHNYGSTSY